MIHLIHSYLLEHVHIILFKTCLYISLVCSITHRPERAVVRSSIELYPHSLSVGWRNGMSAFRVT